MRISTIAYVCAAMAVAICAQLASAQPTPQISGGALDLNLSAIGDVYVERPRDAVGAGACENVQRYVSLIQSGDYESVADLFTPDAVLMEPSRAAPRVGRAALEAFFVGGIGHMRPDIVAVAYAGEGSDCFVELAVRMSVNGAPRYVLTSVDHFTADASGKFTRMIAFGRPLGPGLAPLSAQRE